MISLGCYQAKISKQSIVKGSIYMFFSFLATSIAFILGYSLEKLFLLVYYWIKSQKNIKSYRKNR